QKHPPPSVAISVPASADFPSFIVLSSGEDTPADEISLADSFSVPVGASSAGVSNFTEGASVGVLSSTFSRVSPGDSGADVFSAPQELSRKTAAKVTTQDGRIEIKDETLMA